VCKLHVLVITSCNFSVVFGLAHVGLCMFVRVVADICGTGHAGRAAPFNTGMFTVSVGLQWFDFCTRFHDKVLTHAV